MEVEILGSGTSMGVPMAGCDCEVCRSENPRDRRLRTSAFIRAGDTQILIDTSIDYRQQMLNAGISRLDGVIYTHHHVDHVLGMDDLRSFNIINRKPIRIFATRETLRNLERVFAYAFRDDDDVYRLPQLEVLPIDETPFQIDSVRITPIPLMHGKLPILGFRIGDFAYCTDASAIPEASYNLLKGVRILILNALRYKPHPTHFSVEQAVAEAQKIGAERTYLTHISHAILHEEAEARLPENVRLAYDGLRIELNYPA